ncbi:MAG: hypothetical protein JSS02_33590 [Planctomycetes bacterium]|nr:hypothetical protein [Planctomycetota bacterium]
MSVWVFEKLAGAAVRRDPNETQLFKTEQTDEGEYAGTDALVREILQNSLDARVGTGPVRIHLSLHGPQELPERGRLAQYFQRLAAPLRHREIRFDSQGVPVRQEGFLVCEDFGTRGLVGNELLAKDPPPGSRDQQDFFWFWRNIGRSGKTGDDLGRWGLGKTVYRAASQVGCMFGLTVRSTDGRELLMGQAVLRIHEHEGHEYVPEGYWCAGCAPANSSTPGLPLPISGPAELARFRHEWKLERQPGEPGLSVVVPYVAPELKGQNLLQAICVHFFLPIMRGELIVYLQAPDLERKRLDATTLDRECQNLVWNGPKRTKRHVAPPTSFVARCLAEQSVATTRVLGTERLPELTDAALDPAVLSHLRQSFHQSQLLAVTVRLALPRVQGAADTGQLRVFVQRQPEGTRCDTYYVREGMTITKLNSRAALRGVQALVLVDEGPLASLLGDSEGPAHEDWDTSEDRPSRTWAKWKGRVKFCRRIVDDLVELLNPPNSQADFELLSDFFSIQKARAPLPARLPASSGTGPAVLNPIAAQPHWYRLDGRRGGFRIAPSHLLPIPPQARLRVAVAYDLSTGNPLKKWSPLDFDFGIAGSVTVKSERVTMQVLAGNELLLTMAGDGFSFSAEGFDEHRDLLVRIDEVDDRPHERESEP